MISEKARSGFDYFLMQGIRASFSSQHEDVIDITTISEIDLDKCNKCVALTISSYLFRMMIFVHFTPDDSAKKHFARGGRLSESEMTDQEFVDSISEFSNMACGALSRDLSLVFQNIGMSTPNIIDSECISYLYLLKGGHIQNFNIKVNGSDLFYFSLCVSEYSDIDFDVSSGDVSVDAGELELF